LLQVTRTFASDSVCTLGWTMKNLPFTGMANVRMIVTKCIQSIWRQTYSDTLAKEDNSFRNHIR